MASGCLLGGTVCQAVFTWSALHQQSPLNQHPRYFPPSSGRHASTPELRPAPSHGSPGRWGGGGVAPWLWCRGSRFSRGKNVSGDFLALAIREWAEGRLERFPHSKVTSQNFQCPPPPPHPPPSFSK